MHTKTCSGSCLCGEVRYQITGPFISFQYCHCSRCRKITGSAHASNLFVKPENFSWLEGEGSVGRYEIPDTKYYASGFCRKCGSSLPWLPKGGKGAMVVPAGTLDEDPGIKPERNIFCASQASWRVDCAKLESFDQLPVKKA